MTTAAQDPNTTEGRLNDAERVARGLGWLSIGLGLAQISAPGRVARMIGVDDNEASRNSMVGIGVRELVSGVGMLTRERPVGPVWSRVGGDVMDLALLGRALRSDDGQRNRLAAATAAVIGVTILDVLAGRSLARESGPSPGGAPAAGHPDPESHHDRPAAGRGLPLLAQLRESAAVHAAPRARAGARRPALPLDRARAGRRERRMDRRAHRGPAERVDRLALGGRRDCPQYRLRPIHPGLPWRHRGPGRAPIPAARRPARRLVAKLFGEEPDTQVGSDLRRLKQVLELGEVVHSDASIAPRRCIRPGPPDHRRRRS